MRFRCFEEQNCSGPSMFYSQSLAPTFPALSTGMFPWNQGEKQGTKRKLFSPRGHGFSESPQRQGLSRRYERGAPLSTSAARSLVGGSCECLLSAYYALGTSELF